MVYVRLEQSWTDSSGIAYGAGETVDVDAVTLAHMQAQGLVAEPGQAQPNSWIGPTDDDEPGS